MQSATIKYNWYNTHFSQFSCINHVALQIVLNFVTGRLKYHQYGRVQNQPVNFPFSYIVLS